MQHPNLALEHGVSSTVAKNTGALEVWKGKTVMKKMATSQIQGEADDQSCAVKKPRAARTGEQMTSGQE